MESSGKGKEDGMGAPFYRGGVGGRGIGTDSGEESSGVVKGWEGSGIEGKGGERRILRNNPPRRQFTRSERTGGEGGRGTGRGQEDGERGGGSEVGGRKGRKRVKRGIIKTKKLRVKTREAKIGVKKCYWGGGFGVSLGFLQDPGSRYGLFLRVVRWGGSARLLMIFTALPKDGKKRR